MSSVYTIIVTYNAMQWIDRCLGSLRRSTVPTEVVVVDNGSTDGSEAYIRSHYPEVHLLAQTNNLGFGQGNNAGIRYAMEKGCTHVLLLNQDAWVEEKMIATLLKYDDGQSLLSPIHLTGEGDRIDRNFEKNAIRKSRAYARYAADQEKGVYAKYATDEINAACWLLPRTLLEEIGGFNPLFFHYAEDNDYLQRLHFHGKGIYFVSGTYCYHDRAHVAAKRPSKQLIYQQLVLRAVNINCSRCACWWQRVRYGIAVWHNAIATHRLSDIRLLYQAKLQFFANRKTIRENREVLTTKDAHWLQ